MAGPIDYSKVEHKEPYEDIVAAYDDEQLIKDAEYRLAHMESIPTAISSRQLTQEILDYFKELLAKKIRSEREESELKLIKRNLVSDVLYHQNYEDNKDKFTRFYAREEEWRHKTGLPEENGYYSTKTRRAANGRHLFRGWKFHLDVNPTPQDPLTKEISEFLQKMDIEHKIAHGGEAGKGMTVYTGSYEDTCKVARLVYENFHDRMELPPLWNDNLLGEHFFNPLVCGRFLDSGRPFPTMYPSKEFGAGISGHPGFINLIPADSDAQDAYMTLWVQNARNNGIELPDSKRRRWYSSDNKQDEIIYEALASYTMHKLYSEEFGEYYYGADLDKFEQLFFDGYLPQKGTPEREQWDKIAAANIAFIKEHAGKDLVALKSIVDNYVPIDFSQVQENTLENSGATTTVNDDDDDDLFKNKEDLYNALGALLAGEKSETQILDFVSRKNAYVDGHNEEAEEIHRHIDEVMQDDSVDEDFFEAYQEADLDYLTWLSVNYADDGNAPEIPEQELEDDEEDYVAEEEDIENDNRTAENDDEEDYVAEEEDIENDNRTAENDNEEDYVAEEENYNGLHREFEDNSDTNEARFDRLQYNILLDMDKIETPLSAEELNDQVKVYTATQDAISALSDKEQEQFNVRFADEIVRSADNEFMLRSVPPTVLTQVYNYYGEEIAKAPQGEVDDLIRRQEIVAARMDRLTDEYYTGTRNIVRDNFNYDDRVNIADIYEGYKGMLAARRPHVSEPQQARIDAVDKKLDADMAKYDDDRGIADINQDNIDEVRQKHQTLTKRLADIGLDDETMQFLGNIRFYDENGQVVPQFVDPQTKQDVITWESGYEIKPDSQLRTMVDFARNNTIIENMASGAASLPNKSLQDELQDRLKIQALAWATAEDVVNKALVEPDRFTDDKYLDEFKGRMSNTDRPLNISAQGFAAATQLAVNDTMGLIGRLAHKDHIGDSKDTLLKEMYAPIEKYDARKGTRFDAKGEYNVNWFKTAAWTFGASLGQKLLTYGATLGCAHATSALGLTATAPAAAVTKCLPMVTAVTGMAMAGAGMYMNWKNYKKDAKARGKEPKVKDFFTQKPYATTNVASILGFGAGACLMCGNVPAAAALGVGCLSVAGYGTYKEAREHGLNKKRAAWQSLKKVSAIAVGGGLGSYVGSLLGVTPAWQERGEGTPGYDKDGQVTHDYSGTEHEHATHRLEDPRYSEFLKRFHVASDLQDSANPDNVSSEAVSNLRAAINQAIGDNKQFYTDMAAPGQDANYVANTDVLGYKFEQLAYLAPNPNALIDADYAANVLDVPAGTTVGEYLSMKLPDGSDMNYIDALKEIVSTGKSSNPEGLATMLGKIENVIGMQIDDNVNDAGKITLFGTSHDASPIQSYNAEANVGYDIGKHIEHVDGTPGEVINHGGEKLYGFGYWEPVRGMFGGLKKRIGALADMIWGTNTKGQPLASSESAVVYEEPRANTAEAPIVIIAEPDANATEAPTVVVKESEPKKEDEPNAVIKENEPDVIVQAPLVSETKDEQSEPITTPDSTVRTGATVTEERKLMVEEYWMIHGYNPAQREIKGDDGKAVKIEINPMLDAGYKAYAENVEAERVAAGGKPMTEFLQERRKKIDSIVEDNIAAFNSSFAAQANADIFDPDGYKKLRLQQAEMAKNGKTMSKEDVDNAIKWPTSGELTSDYQQHRPTSKIIRIVRDAFWRKHNAASISAQQEDSDSTDNTRTTKPAERVVFSFDDFTKSAVNTLVRTSEETDRDTAKAAARRTFDDAGMHRIKEVRR